ITSAFTLNSGAIADLQVTSTAGFTSSNAHLFVQTTNGVATIHYTGTTATSFTGCSVVGDTYNVGAGDETGTLDTTYHAVFQATHQTFDISIPNQTGLPNDGKHDIYYSMFWSSVGGSVHDFYTLYQDSPGHYKFVNFKDYTNGTENAGHGTNSALPDFQAAASGTTTIAVPYMPINSGRIYFFVGPTGLTSPLTTQDNGSGVWSVVQPSSGSADYIYDFFEVNLDANGSAAAGAPNPDLAKMTIDTTQVDQFGIPMTLTGDSNDTVTTTSYSAGVTDSTDVARNQIINAFSSQYPPGNLYNQLIVGPSAQSQGLPLRIVNPADADITTSSELGYVFDSVIKTLFETGTTSLTLHSNKDGTDYTGTRTTHTETDINGHTQTYNVLQFTNGTNTFYIYEPFFSTNAPSSSSLSSVSYASAPPPPSWLLHQKSETAGQMVFANNGVFADYANQPGGLTATQQGILGDLENQVVAALNRGVALLDSSQWQVTGNYYQTGPYNEYARFLHEYAINGTPIMIGGHAYAFPYDDNGGSSTTLNLDNQTGATVTLGPWTRSGSSTSNDGFLAAVYLDVLHREIDSQGETYWLGLLAGGWTRADVSLGIVDSLESRTDVIKGFYTNLLHRDADAPGLAHCLQLFDEGFTSSQIKSMFYGSEEYFQVRGGGANSGFIDAVFQDQLSRAPGGNAQSYFDQIFAAGHSRAYAAGLVVDSTESLHDQVNDYYRAYLLRPVDAAGLAHFDGILAQSNHDNLIQAGILGSPEFYDRTR
ncbi:MAG TPA: beta-1,3-glucanase family protein, partial [Pirellulales bacterium]|nr:beta-1,3-glucanase family protein [Pirellulales bacterium]